MVDLSTRYLGLDLKNPIIISSCSLTNSLKNLQIAEKHGAGAVILKSLFEEQILAENEKLIDDSLLNWNAESYEYISKLSMEYGPEYYINLIKEAKEQLQIPVIASLNCISDQWWIEYAKKIEFAGADALELNIALLPTNWKMSGESIEQRYFQILKEIKENVNLPIAVKIGPNFSSFTKFVNHLVDFGAKGLVLFNRFYHFDIDIDRISLKPNYSLSSPSEIYNALRWISILSGDIKADLCATTGIYDFESAVKFLLAGADAIQICSTIYKNGFEVVETILNGLSDWMDSHDYHNIEAFKGKLNQVHSESPEQYERIQYIKGLTKVD